MLWKETLHDPLHFFPSNKPKKLPSPATKRNFPLFPRRQSYAESSLESAYIWSRHLHQQKNTLVLPIKLLASLSPPSSNVPFGSSRDTCSHVKWATSRSKSQWCLNLNNNSSFVYIANDKQKSVWNQPITKSDQSLFQMTLSKSNSSSVIRVTAISRVPAIVWREVVCLVSNFDTQKFDLVIRAVKLCPDSAWLGSSDV